MGKLLVSIVKNVKTGEYPEEGELSKIMPLITNFLIEQGYESNIEIIKEATEVKKMKYSAKLERLSKEMIYSEPFAGYKDFDDCVRKNSDKDDPKAYCAVIKKQVGESVK